MSDLRFRAYPQFNRPEYAHIPSLRHRVNAHALPYFTRPTGPDRLARALAERRAIDIKELMEASEFYARTRRRLRSPHVADLCCGHGLAGLLFALERQVQTVTLLDLQRPKSFGLLLEVFAELYPHVPEKIRYVEAGLEDAASFLEEGASVLAIHACGVRTDRCIDVALEISSSAIAAMPCCYNRTAWDAPRAIRAALGVEMATDIHRTYRLQAAGYQVEWSAIPQAITPMNRILIALPS